MFRYIPEEKRYDTESFLESPEARGIVEKTLPTMFDQLPEVLEAIVTSGNINIASEKWLTITLVASWNRALYDLWWRPITNRIQKDERRAVKKRKHLRKKEEKINKNVTAKAAEAIRKRALKKLKKSRKRAEERRRAFKSRAQEEKDDEMEEPIEPRDRKRKRDDNEAEQPPKKKRPNDASKAMGKIHGREIPNEEEYITPVDRKRKRDKIHTMPYPKCNPETYSTKESPRPKQVRKKIRKK
jgi:hypothetical protein